MAGGWIKSLHCKSRVYDDVITSTSCRHSYQNLKDVINVDPPKFKKPDPLLPKPNPKPGRVRKRKPDPVKYGSDPSRIRVGFPSVMELPLGHTSRNVVEIIFQSKWSPRGFFSGRVEMVFKVLSPARVSARFEEYRDLIKLRANTPGCGARCEADGNEMMRFHCLGQMDGFDCATSAKAICTYNGSGMAHDSVGGGKGRRVMVVSRVIAGRVIKRVGVFDPVNLKGKNEFDSVSGENGELFVYDSRAVLPCFLVIYKL